MTARLVCDVSEQVYTPINNGMVAESHRHSQSTLALQEPAFQLVEPVESGRGPSMSTLAASEAKERAALSPAVPCTHPSTSPTGAGNVPTAELVTNLGAGGTAPAPSRELSQRIHALEAVEFATMIRLATGWSEAQDHVGEGPSNNHSSEGSRHVEGSVESRNSANFGESESSNDSAVYSGRPKVLIVDVRPYTAYAASHIRGAISICIPSTLLKRSTFGFQHIVEFVAQQDAIALTSIASYDSVVLYDASSTALTLRSGDTAVFRTALKFLTAPGMWAQLYYLRGGIASVQREFPDLVDVAGPETGGCTLASEPKSPFNLMPVLTTRTPLAPSPLGMGPSPVSARTAGVVSVLDQSSRIEVPGAVLNRLNEFPHWVRHVVEETQEGHNVLAENFHELESGEHARVQGAFGRRPRSRMVSPRTPRSPRTPVSPGVASGRIAQATTLELAEDAFTLCPGNDPAKNRYTNICPFIYNRVRLHNSEPGKDYINASYVTAPHVPLRYIASQAPVPASFADFWRCVWEHKTPLIMMLTTLYTDAGLIKCHKYWQNGRHGEFEVQTLSRRELEPGYILREFLLTGPGDESRVITHLQYERWPDLGCPSDPKELLRLVELKESLLSEFPADSQVIVHCSAGCGRTGTLCTVDAVTHYLAKNPSIEDATDRVFETVQSLREQRLAMVQNQRQLRLCYTAVILWLYGRLPAPQPIAL